MRIFATGGTGVLGRHTVSLLRQAGHEVVAPGSTELDLLDHDAVRDAVAGADAVYHMATRIPPPEQRGDPAAWEENDRLRGEVTPILVRAALVGGAEAFVLPTVAFVYPPGPVDELSPVRDDLPDFLKTALVAEQAVAGFTASDRRGVVLRLGLLHGPGTGLDAPDLQYGSSLEIGDAARALVAALSVDAGTYNVVAEDGPVSSQKFREATGWSPTR